MWNFWKPFLKGTSLPLPPYHEVKIIHLISQAWQGASSEFATCCQFAVCNNSWKLNTATQGCSRRGRAWAPGQKPSPTLQMKWHFVQGSTESRKLESRSPPLWPSLATPLFWKVWLHKWFMHWITGLNLTLYGCCIAAFWWAFTSLDCFTIWPWKNSTTKHSF